ncbi:hypothetical protein JI58_05720 [Marinosulfonomonas sp. PRT-SC04]|nr:hypothetical protein JI58_05720 [Marinosulfonomonas sp. PRT-SC04]
MRAEGHPVLVFMKGRVMKYGLSKVINIENKTATRPNSGGIKAVFQRKLGLFRLDLFRQDDDGSVTIFGLYMFICMLIISGLAFDTMQVEYWRTKIQYTTDRALLASASMNQTLSAQEIFDDYFAKAGMPGQAPTATVENGLNFRTVSAEYAPDDVPRIKTLFMSKAFRSLLDPHKIKDPGGIDFLPAIASGAATDNVDKVEISLVLDVSGSMGSQSASGHTKLYDLQVAANQFIDALLLNRPTPDTYSISIVPYATQVNAGANLLSKYNVTAEHDYSNCVDFTQNAFFSAALSTSTSLQRTGHFAPWGGSYKNRPIHWKSRVCPTVMKRQILPLSAHIPTLKGYINNLEASGNTSTDIGIKWGAALLDPSARTVVSGLISDGAISNIFDGRPYSYSQDDVLKVIVVMSDGRNTSQYYLKKVVSGGYANPAANMSNVWRKGLDENSRYAIYNPNRWQAKKYFRTYKNSTNGYWASTPGTGMKQMAYVDLYDHATIRYVTSYMMSPAGHSYNYWRSHTFVAIGSSTKDTRMAAICAAAKDNDILIFTIGFEVTESNAIKLKNCASTPGHFFRVDGVDIAEAFASIAAQLHKLRLKQ